MTGATDHELSLKTHGSGQNHRETSHSREIGVSPHVLYGQGWGQDYATSGVSGDLTPQQPPVEYLI